jgi:uncharacterized protein YpmB
MKLNRHVSTFIGVAIIIEVVQIALAGWLYFEYRQQQDQAAVSKAQAVDTALTQGRLDGFDAATKYQSEFANGQGFTHGSK